MSNRSKVGIVFLCSSLTLSTNWFISLPVRAQGAAERKTASAVLPDGQVVAGVKLIEDILSHVRSAPQLAMVPKKQDGEQAVAKDKGGPTDYRLAIRPREMSRRATAPQTPTLNLLPAAADKVDKGEPVIAMAPPAFAPAPYPASLPSSSARASYGAANSGAFSEGSRLEKKGTRAKAETQAINGSERWLGSQLNKEASAHVQSFSQDEGLAPAEKKTGIWEREQLSAGLLQGAPVGGSGGFSSETRAGEAGGASSGSSVPPVLSVSPGPLADAAANSSRSIASNAPVPELAESNASNGPSPPGSLLTPVTRSNFPGGAKVPLLNKQAQEARLDTLTAAGSKKNVSKSVSADYRGYGAGNAAGANLALSKYKKQEDRPARQELIALLPPNVATGIPLVRLGAQQTQVSQALKELGTMRSVQVNGWTVLSWYRSASPDKPALALYIRHGIVNAMRIFDASLIGADFGVNLGQDLDCVKEKFGEPSFILSEPLPGTGKNYVYPISQIAFQLFRSKTYDTPKVASILIFNVK